MNSPLLWLRHALRGWGWLHTSMGLLLGTLALFNMGALLLYSGSFNAHRAWVYNVLEFGLPGVLALRMADAAVAGGARRWLAYSVAVVVVICTGVWVIGPLLYPLLGGETEWGLRQDVMLALNLALPFSVGTVAYAHWRQGSDRLLRLQNAEVARATEERLLQSARLLALQARVEPQLLFDTLGRVRDASSPSPHSSAAVPADTPAKDGAGQLLDDLCALLRALQPAAGATASTLAREWALVQAYARVAAMPALLPPRLQWVDQPLHVEQRPVSATDLSGYAPAARLAPLLLLPALRSLVGDAPQDPWRLLAVAAAGRLRISIQPLVPTLASGVALAALDVNTLRSRAQAVHGPDASVAVQVNVDPHTPTACVIDLALSFEPAPPDEPTNPYVTHPSPDR
jgi:hypothetical protein